VGLINRLRDAFARLLGAAPAGPKTVKVEMPGPVVQRARPAKPPKKPYRVGAWFLEPFPPARVRIAASRLGRLAEFDGYDRNNKPTWRIR